MHILYEDNHIIAVNKKNSDLSQGDRSGDETLGDKIKAYIKKKYNKPGDVYLGVAHRLDRPVSGVIVYARTSKALTRLSEMFKNGEVDKTYYAIVQKRPAELEGRLEHYLLKDANKNKTHVFQKAKGKAKKAILDYKLLLSSQNYSLLEIKLHTGRHHQIRCQLARIGSPIKGDLKYGAPRSNKEAGISLHARQISFIHPVKKERITITAPLPIEDNLWKSFSESID